MNPNTRTPYQHLPIFAKITIERLDADNDLRTGAQLDELLDAYAKTYGTTCDAADRASAHHICTRRFWDYDEKTEQELDAEDAAAITQELADKANRRAEAKTSQEPDTKPGNYYVTAIDGARIARLAGPFHNDHAGALAMVPRARAEAERADARAVWYAFGTCRVDLDVPAKSGVLNDRLGLPTQVNLI